jgi:hypothetical protein
VAEDHVQLLEVSGLGEPARFTDVVRVEPPEYGGHCIAEVVEAFGCVRYGPPDGSESVKQRIGSLRPVRESVLALLSPPYLRCAGTRPQAGIPPRTALGLPCARA